MRHLRVLPFCFLLWGQEADTTRLYILDTIYIQGISLQHATVSESGVERISRLLPFTQLVYRSVPFAQEVAYQGLLPTQTQITIEGMRVVPACVDRMDPVLTFVEAAVIEEASWQRAARWGAMPTLQVGLFSSEGPNGGGATLMGGDNYHRLFLTTRHREQFRRFRLATALTFRLGSNYAVGGSSIGSTPSSESPWKRDTLLDIPSFKKFNLYTTCSYDLSEEQRVEFSYMGDYFYDVAYPALIMDARHSAMHLLSFRHRWKSISDFRLYANTVFHDMTDENRPESLIRSRPVMPNMYMPMRGITRTAGTTWMLTWWEKAPFQIQQYSEYSYTAALSSMEMLPLDGGSRMFLMNLADIRFHQGGTALSLSYRKGSWKARVEGRGSAFVYRIRDTLSYRPLLAYQVEYAGEAQMSRSFVVYEIKGELERSFGAHTLSWSLSQGTRPPTHMELYAYYLYVPMDNSIQMGNSLLRPEGLARSELTYSFTWRSLALSFQTFANSIRNYISPVTFMPLGAPSNQSSLQWRILKNTGRAYTLGFSLRAALHPTKNTLIELWSGYTYGQHESLREPLPWIYPFFGRLRFTQRYGPHRVTIELHGTATQSRISQIIYMEDPTPGYWLAHLRYGFSVWEKGSSHLTLTASVENLLDTYGWDHLSVGNMPFLGRVFRVGAICSW
ncbi:MAG: TonB-dependent receptor [Bacteroidia bacterium]|nr:TonB-dependent receptor [Bacteroidia bacterium]